MYLHYHWEIIIGKYSVYIPRKYSRVVFFFPLFKMTTANSGICIWFSVSSSEKKKKILVTISTFNELILKSNSQFRDSLINCMQYGILTQKVNQFSLTLIQSINRAQRNCVVS